VAVSEGDENMREFAKSAMSFSWALSLLGVNSAVNMLRPDRPKNADGLGPVTEVAVNQLDETMRGVYRYGDNIQTRVIDTAFSWLNPGNWSKMTPMNFVRTECPGSGAEAQQQAAPDPAAQPAASAGSGDPGTAETSGGWGPMPAN
jgi:hypothetical protein